VFFHNVMMKSGTLVYAQNTRYTAADASDSATHDSANGACCTFTFAGSLIDTPDNSLSRCSG
jgi:hypothetical protein